MYKVIIINDGLEMPVHHHAFNEIKVKDGSISEGINDANSFKFVIFPDNPAYDKIRPLRTLVRVYDMRNGRVIFDGRVLNKEESMNDSGAFTKSVFCEDELGYLNDSAQRHGEYHNISVRDFLQVMIDNHNNEINKDEINKTFKLGIVDVANSSDNLYRYLGYESTLDTIHDKLISRLGGELRVRKENGIRYLDYLTEIGEVKSTEVRLTKNLKSIIKTVDARDVVTHLIPLGARIESEDEEATDASQARVTIESVNNGRDYIEDSEAKKIFGVVARSEVWDDVNMPSILKSRGEEFLRINNRVRYKFSVSALDHSLLENNFDSFEVGNYHKIINPVMGINEFVRIIQKTTNIIEPSQNELIFGDRFKTATEHHIEALANLNEVVNLPSTVSRQTSLINNVNSNLRDVENNLSNFETVISNDMKNLNTTISELQKIVDDLKILVAPDEIMKIKADIEELQRDMEANKRNIDDLNTRVSKLEGGS